jgi:genome maintenance exonuclease 1
VTSILRKTRPESDQVSLKQWRERVGQEEADRISKESIQRGRELHKRIQRYLNKRSTGVCTPELEPWRDSLIPLMRKIDQAYLVEGMVFHDMLKYAGTVDAIAHIEGHGLTLCEWKTANSWRRESWLIDYKLQLIAFREAIQATYNIQLDSLLLAIALPNRTAQEVWIHPEEAEELWELWLSRLEQWMSMGLQKTAPI